jgi:hypothetical protein
MKKGLFILLLFILSTIQHDFVTLGYKGSHMNNFGVSTSAIFVTSDCNANFDQSINKSHSITEVPIINTPASEQISKIEDFFQREIQFVEDLFLKIESLNPKQIAFVVEPGINPIFRGTDGFLFGCNFRL